MAYKRISPAPVIEGGTGAVTLTSHGVLLGAGTGAINILAEAATGSTLMGSTGANPAFTGSPSFSGTVTAATGLTNTTGTISLNSGTSACGISTDASATTVSIATGGAVKTVTLGSTNTTSSLALKSGSGNVAINSGLTIDSTGRNYNTVQPAFLAYLNNTIVTNVTGNGAVYTLGTTALTKVFDQGTNFNTNGTFTAPITARYHMSAGSLVIGTTIASTFNLGFVTSNRNYLFQLARVAGNQNYGLNGTSMADFDAADTMTVTVQVSGEAADTDDVYGDTGITTFIGGVLVC